MKQKLLNSIRLRALLLVATLLVGGANFNLAWATVVTYTVTSKTEVSTSGTAPTSSDATYSQTYNTSQQATSGNSFTLTLSGWNGYTISNITLSMKSNKSAGAGKLSYSTDGGKTYTYVVGSSGAGVGFNDSAWNGSYSTSYVGVSKDVEIEASSSNIVIKIEATANSLYCQSYAITYDVSSSSSAEATTTAIDPSGITNKNIYEGTSAGLLSATVKDDSGNVIDGASVTWSSSDEGVATINSVGEVTLVAEGTTTITASYAGEDGVYNSSSDTYELTVINEDPTLTTIWSEDFSSYSKDDVPDGGTYSYKCVEGNSATKIYEESGAGGESPELLVNKKGTYNGSFSATIPLGDKGYVGTLKLKFKNNNTISVSAQANTGTMLKSSTSVSGNTTTGNTVSIPGVTAEMTSVTVKWSNGTSSNVRIDDIVLKGKEAPAKPSFSEDAKVFDSAFEMTISSADGTTLKYTTDGTNPASSGTAIAVDSNSKTITIPTGSNVTIKAVTISSENVSRVSTVTYTYDSRTTPSFSLSSTEVALKVNQEGSVILTTDFDGTITVTSSNSTNMPVSYNPSTKVCTFTPSQADNYTISFSATGSENYKDAAAEVSVTVTKKSTTMVIETFFEEGLDLKTAEEGLIEGTVKYEDSALSPKPTVTYSSSDTNVATVAADGTITFKMSGSTTLKASYAGDDEYEACEAEYVLELVDTTPQETEVSISLNNTFFDCEAFTSYEKGSPTSYEASKNNITVTYDKGTGFYCNATGLRLYTGGSLTFAAPAGYVITKIVLSGQDGFYEGLTNPEASTTWTGKASTVSITGETKKESTRKNMTGATVTLAETVTVGSAGYTTYVAKHDISFPYGVTAYISTIKTSETLTLTEKASVPEGTAVILKGDAGTYALPTIKITPESVDGNLLQASDGSVTGDGSTIYALAEFDDKVGFYQVNNGIVIPAGKAYLVDGAGVKGFTFDFDDDDATGISLMEDGRSKMEDGAIYNVAGQRISKMQKGINIVNGKKVLK